MVFVLLTSSDGFIYCYISVSVTGGFVVDLCNELSVDDEL